MIKVENLVKTFGPKRAVDGVSFSVEHGEVLGFLGPNGAGKSTSMRMLTGFIPPTEGKVTVGGFDMLENPIPIRRLAGMGFSSMSKPPTVTLPSVGGMKPVSMRMLVDLPAPFGPRKPSTSPCSTENETPSTARLGPKVLTRFSTLIMCFTPSSTVQ